MKILIVGWWIAWLACAWLLRKSGSYTVHIVEKKENYRQLWFNIGIRDIGRRVLDELWVAEQFDTFSVPNTSFTIQTLAGDTLKNIDFGRFAESYPIGYNYISRRALHEILYEPVKDCVRLWVQIESIAEKSNEVEVQYADWKRDQYDILIAADGARSWVREKYMGYGFWKSGKSVIYGRLQEWVQAPSDCGGWVEMTWKGKIFHLFSDEKGVCVAFTLSKRYLEWVGNEDFPTLLRKEFADCPAAIDALNNVNEESLVATSPAIVHIPQWLQWRVVLVWDAAHAMPPSGWLGWSMALEDVSELVKQLDMCGDSYKQAFIAYEKRRRPRVAKALSITRRNYRRATFPMTDRWWIRRRIAKYIPESFFLRGYEELLEKSLCND